MNFVTRDPSNYNQHDQSPGTVSFAQPHVSFDLNNMQMKTPSLPQTEAVKTLLCAEREAAVTRELKSKIFFIFNCLKKRMVGARPIQALEKEKESR